MLLICQILIKLDNSNSKLTRYFINIIFHSIHKPQISNIKHQILSSTFSMSVSMEFLYSVFISVV